ncbi:murein biosynthesis integral membrane protein MurJ [Candidatus Shapirobacteria bacterium CG_4_9_14_3_um_filter_36_12]|uniref:Probable lipid II flippase MurJ n=2 Tax=Candidatus Shapironibacteriota TaxID=1752721 RepID=A0A1J5HQI9_9BACT|nr:MAG: murein biosynthesis integral membrane protein MurJ [Candidatus Shapirobacteria bacterium CG2_30_35_20]PJA51319.1 MAG: murein biosynthesis integral membrane protein MurJ [Candidatus Shapirobacteria bacterium CG_4_9_14_3_um_filter_36_12]
MHSLSKFRKLIGSRQNSISSASVILAITFGLSAILGFLRSRFLYAQFFQCCILDLDAYNAAFRLPDLIFKLLVTGALSASFIPVFASYLHKDKKIAYRMASSVINILLLVFTFSAIVIFIFARPLSTLIAQGFSDYQVNLMVNMTRILLLAQIFFLLSNFITAILHVGQNFLIPALSPIIYNIFIILSIFTLAPIFGIYGPVYGAVVGAFFHLVSQLPLLKRKKFKYKTIIDTNISGVREVFRLMLPRSLSLGLGEIENTVTLFFASSLVAGSISILNLSLQLVYLPSRIFGSTVGQASLPILAKSIAKNQHDIFRDTVRKTVLRSLYLALPISALILVNRVAIVRIAFGTKEFPWSATLLTAKTLAFLVPAIASQAIVQILVRAFYALHDTKTPLKISFISLFFNILSSYLFINFTNWGILGLAVSASLSNLIQCFGLWFVFIQKVDGSGWPLIFERIGKIFMVSILSGLISWLSLQLVDQFVFDTSKTFFVMTTFSVCIINGAIGYLVFSKIFKIKELDEFIIFFQKASSIFTKN